MDTDAAATAGGGRGIGTCDKWDMATLELERGSSMDITVSHSLSTLSLCSCPNFRAANMVACCWSEREAAWKEGVVGVSGGMCVWGGVGLFFLFFSLTKVGGWR